MIHFSNCENNIGVILKCFASICAMCVALDNIRVQCVSVVYTVYNVHAFPEELSIFLEIPVHQKCYFLP